MLKRTFACFLGALLFLGVSFPCMGADRGMISADVDWVKDAPEEYIPLLRIVPRTSYEDGVTTYETLGNQERIAGGSTDFIFQNELFCRGILDIEDPVNRRSVTNYELAQNPDAVRIPSETVISCYEDIFGPESGEFLREIRQRKDLFFSTYYYLPYEAETDCFAYIPYVSGTSGDIPAATRSYGRFLQSETEGEEIRIRLRFCFITFVSETCYLSEDANLERGFCMVNFLAQELRCDESFSSRLRNGAFDEFLPIYEITFRENGNGGYYWASTEKISSGKEILQELWGETSALHSFADGVSSEGDHTILGGNWGSTSAQPSTDTQQPPADDDSAPLWGAIVGWGAVAVALAVGAVLLVKRYKK